MTLDSSHSLGHLLLVKRTSFSITIKVNLVARKSVLSGNISLLPLFLRESFTGIRFLIDHDFSSRALNVSSHYLLVLIISYKSAVNLIKFASYCAWEVISFSLAALKFFFSLCLSAVLLLVCLFVDHLHLSYMELIYLFGCVNWHFH